MNRLGPYPLVAVGGVVGAMVRWSVAEVIATESFPWATLVVNVFGAGLLAWVPALQIDNRLRMAVATGFCGGLTTMSTLSLETVELADDGRIGTAMIYVVASVVTGLAAYVPIHRAATRRMHL